MRDESEKKKSTPNNADRVSHRIQSRSINVNSSLISPIVFSFFQWYIIFFP